MIPRYRGRLQNKKIYTYMYIYIYINIGMIGAYEWQNCERASNSNTFWVTRLSHVFCWIAIIIHVDTQCTCTYMYAWKQWCGYSQSCRTLSGKSSECPVNWNVQCIQSMAKIGQNVRQLAQCFHNPARRYIHMYMYNNYTHVQVCHQLHMLMSCSFRQFHVCYIGIPMYNIDTKQWTIKG